MEGEGRGAGLRGYLAPECQLLSIRARVCSWLPLLPYLTFYCLWFVSMAEASAFSFPCFLVGIPREFRLSVAPHLIFEQECLEPSTRHFCGFDIGRGGGAWEKAQPWTVASPWCREPSAWPRGFWLLPSRALGRSPRRFSSWGPPTTVLWCGQCVLWLTTPDLSSRGPPRCFELTAGSLPWGPHLTPRKPLPWPHWWWPHELF